MTVCKYFRSPQGCLKGSNCRFEHPGATSAGNVFGGSNNARSETSFGGMNKRPQWNLNPDEIRKDLTESRPNWILSSYGPTKDVPASLFLDNEYSSEEVRARFYEQQRNGNADVADQEAIALWTKARNDMELVARNVIDVAKFMVDKEKQNPTRYDFCTMDGSISAETFAKNSGQVSSGQASRNAFGSGLAASPFSQPASGQQTSAFGKSPFSSSPFGNSAINTQSQSAFGQSTASNNTAFGQPAFGGNASQPAPAFGQTPGLGQNASANPFAKPAAFGQPAALGTAASSNPFAKPAAFGQSQGGSPFGSTAQTTSQPAFGQSPFGQGAGQTNTASPFGQAANKPVFGQPPGQPSFGQAGGGFGQTSASPFGAPAPANKTQSPFGQAGGSATNNTFGSSQAATSPFCGGQNTSSPFGQTQTNSNALSSTQSANPFGGAQKNTGPFGGASNAVLSSTPFGGAQITTSPFGGNQTAASNNPFARTTSNTSPFGQPTVSNTVIASTTETQMSSEPTQIQTRPSQVTSPDPTKPTNKPIQPLHYTQTLPQAPTQTNGRQIISYRNMPVQTVNTTRPTATGSEVPDTTTYNYNRPDRRGLEQIWFPLGSDDPVVQKLANAAADYQEKDDRYSDAIKAEYAFLFETGRFKDGKIPLVPPMRAWLDYDF